MFKWLKGKSYKITCTEGNSHIILDDGQEIPIEEGNEYIVQVIDDKIASCDKVIGFREKTK